MLLGPEVTVLSMISRSFKVFLQCIIDWEYGQSEIIASKKMPHFFLFTAMYKLGLQVRVEV